MKTFLSVCAVVSIGLYMLLSMAFSTLQSSSKAAVAQAEATVNSINQ